MDIKQRIRHLAELVTLARKAYHSSTHRPVLDRGGAVFKMITDAEYDAYEEELRAIAPKHALFSSVGSDPLQGTKVTLPHPMGSLGKVKPDGSAAKWLKAVGKQAVCVSNKLDGISAEILYNPRKVHTHQMFSRGNGYEGCDISALLPYIQVGHLSGRQCIRGELVIDDADFEEWAGEFANSRNLVAGVANAAGQSGRVHKAARSIKFIAHGQLYPATTLYDSDLEADGWAVVTYGVYHFWKSKDSEARLIQILKEERATSPCQIDGLVLETPDGEQIAFKGVDKEAVVEVGYVDWRVGRHGAYKPVVMLKTPTPLDGVTVVKATAHNARFLINHSIGPGAKIRIVRSGGVIPKIVGTVVPVDPQMPPEGTYAWDATETNFKVSVATEESRREVSQRSLVHFATCLGIEGIQGGQAGKLVDGGFDNPLLLAKGTVEQFRDCGLGKVAANNLAADIEYALANTVHLWMMNASGVFPHGWGERRLATVLASHEWPELLLMVTTFDEDEFYERVKAINGIERRLSDQLYEGVEQYARWINELGWTCNDSLPEDTRPVGPLNGVDVVFTKVRNANLATLVTELGGRVTDSVTAKTKWVVTIPGAQSTKIKSAEKKGVKIVTVEQLRRELQKYTRV